MILCQKCKSMCTIGEWKHGKYCDSCYKEFEAIDYVISEAKAFRKKYVGGGIIMAFLQRCKCKEAKRSKERK